MTLSESIAQRLAYRAKVDTPFKQRLEMAMCAQDPVHWCNHWVWTYDPRECSFLPLDLFAKQMELMRWLKALEQNQEPGLIEKSRDWGASWICCTYAAHGWLFRSGFKAGMGTYVEDKLDKIGDPDSLFEKIRILLDNLPAWMLPVGYSRSQHANFCKIVNPANGATITGEVGDNMGRGGRTTIYFVDESAHLEHAQRIETSLSQTTRVRVDASTPNGPGNWFAKRRFGGKVKVFTAHWKDDPRKNMTAEDDPTVYPWYEEQKARLDAVTVAQELDINYAASIEGICIPGEWVRAAVNLLPPPGRGPIVGGFDVAEFGNDICVLIPRQLYYVLPDIPNWGKCNTTESAWRARDQAKRLGISEVGYDAGGPGSGITGPWQTAEEALPFVSHPVQFGGSPTEAYWPDGMTSGEKFLNLRAEMWWRMRTRFEKSYEFKELGVIHPLDEMISIPEHPQLIAELSLPLVFRTDKGKIQLESKTAMRKRGVKSPNFGDALAISCLLDGGPWWTPPPKSDRPVQDVPDDAWRRGAGMSVDDQFTELGW